MSARQSIVRGRHILRSIADEVVDRTPVETPDHRAARQTTLLARDNDPAILNFQKPELQRARVELAVEELRVAVSQRCNEAQRREIELPAALRSYGSIGVLAVGGVGIGAAGSLPVGEVQLDQRIDPARDDDALGHVEIRSWRSLRGANDAP